MSNDGDRHAAVRAITGTALDYNGDWMALFDAQSIPTGDHNGRLLKWINNYLSASYTEINGAKAAFALAVGSSSWDEVGYFAPSWVVNISNPPDIAIDWANNRAWKKGAGLFTPSSLITTVRASSKTNLFPTSASGFAYSTFGNNVPSITSLGLSVEEARTNVLLNSTAPVTQTTASLATGTYTLWVNGSGSATSSAGSATITGAGAATNGTPNVFVVTVAGTVTITVSGSLNAFQCELGTFGTSLIVTAGATTTRAADVVTLTAPPTFGSAYSLYAKGTPQAPVAYGSGQVAVGVDDGTANNRTTCLRNQGTGIPQFNTVVGGAAVNAGVNIGGGAWAQNISGKVAVAYAASDQAAYFNGPSTVTTTTTIPPITTVRVGSYILGSFWNGFIEYNAIFLQRVPNAQLQSMTT